MKRAAIYARVSTKNNGQNPETQLVALRGYVQNRGWEITAEYVDHGISGSKDSRPQLDRLMKDARARKLDVVIVARFDRFARSTRHLILALEEFQSVGVDFISLNESIDTSTAMGKMVFTVLGAVAELERNIIRERVTAGLRRAKKEGKTLGRPRVIVDREKVRQLHGHGSSVRIIANQLGLTKSTVHSIVAE
ncbi:MAG TPA: recombinase family protein [Terriglobia bacterium]|nr:recombinase family protein [Terriglobia bacterium]